MYKVETIISNPLIQYPKVNVPKWITLETAAEQKISGKSGITGIIRIYHMDQKICDFPREYIGQLWFIVLQLIRQSLEEKMGQWRFPDLLKFELLDNQKNLAITIEKYTGEIKYVLPRKEIIASLLDACGYFLEKYEEHIKKTYPEYPSSCIIDAQKDIKELKEMNIRL